MPPQSLRVFTTLRAEFLVVAVRSGVPLIPLVVAQTDQLAYLLARELVLRPPRSRLGMEVFLTYLGHRLVMLRRIFDPGRVCPLLSAVLADYTAAWLLPDPDAARHTAFRRQLCNAIEEYDGELLGALLAHRSVNSTRPYLREFGPDPPAR